MSNKVTFTRIIKHHFGFPVTINWGYSLFICAIGTLLTYMGQRYIFAGEGAPSSSSLMGYSLTILVLTVLALLLPVSSLYIERKNNPRNVIVDSVGKFTGIGPLILALISGVALMLVRVPLHNLFTWLWLRIGRTPIFPAFFFVNDGTSGIERAAGLFTGTIIPAFGISLFFTGLMWSCFSDKEKKIGGLIIAVSLSLFSLNFFDIAGIFITGIWLCFLRRCANNVWAPFLALTGCGLTELLFSRFVKSVDITMVQVYSDIDSTYFYSSLPAFLVGLILLLFFAKTLNEFHESYSADFTVSDDEEKKENYLTKGINTALICALTIFIILWVFVLKGERT